MKRFVDEKLQLDLSEMRAGFLFDYSIHEIPSFAYNRRVEDAQKDLPNWLVKAFRN